VLQARDFDRRFVARGIQGKPRLLAPELRVCAVALEKLVVPPALADPALLEQKDAVGMDHRGEPVGDRDDGAAGADTQKRLVDRTLGGGIER
jgi:hypothetical protein